jgi:hypothetical protein
MICSQTEFYDAQSNIAQILCLLHRPYKYLLLHYIVFTQVRSAGQLLGVAPQWRHFMLNGATMAPS